MKPIKIQKILVFIEIQNDFPSRCLEINLIKKSFL